MTSSILLAAASWGAICTVWMVLLLMQQRVRRAGLLLEPLPVPAEGDDASWPDLCVVIPARNEAATIQHCVRHVLAQDYPRLRLLVVDDRSDDATAARIEEMASSEPRVRLHQIEALPCGWLGKSHALWSATRGETAEWLLFLDADTTLHPAAVRTAYCEAARQGSDVLTLWPRNGASGFWEQLIIPLCGGIIALWFGSPSASRISRPFGNGQFMLIRRSAYERIDGHRGVRDALIEDIPLAQRCAAAAAKVASAGGARLLAVNMYQGLRATGDGWARIFVGALRSPVRLIGSLLWLLLGSLLPYFVAPALVWQIIHSPSAGAWLLLGICLQHLVLIHLVSYRFWRMGLCDARYLWLYPLSVILVMWILARAAWTLIVARSVTWRGVRYRIDTDARITSIFDASARPRRLAWTIWIVLSAISAAGLRHYRVDNSLDGWLPELRSVGPHASYVVIGWQTAQLKRAEVLERLRTISGNAGIIDLPTALLIGGPMGVTPENFVLSPDGTFEGLFCFRAPEVSDQQFVSDVRTALWPLPSLTIAGPSVYATTLDQVSQQHMHWILLAVTLTGFTLLWALTRDAHCAAAGVAGITLSQVVLVGVIAWLGIPMGMSLTMVPPLMMALGYSYVAHRSLHCDQGRSGSTRVLALCAITTLIGIASFAWTPLPPIRSFAIASVAGIALIWIAAVTLVPSASSVDGRVRHSRPIYTWALRAVLAAHTHHRAVLTFAALTVLAALLLSTQLCFVSDPLTFFPARNPAVRDFTTLDQRLTGMLPFQVRTTVDHPVDLIAASPGIRKVIDITPIIPNALRREHILWCLADNAALPQLAAAAPSWRKCAADAGRSLEWLGVAAQLEGANRLIRAAAVASLPAVAVSVAAILLLATRRIQLALIGAAVALLPVAGLIVVCAVLRIPLNLTSLMIGSIAIGVAVDDVLHITAAAHQQSLDRAVVECWNPCVGSSFINIICLLTFTISPFSPTRQFGLLMATSIAMAAIANQLVLPALLRLVTPALGHASVADRSSTPSLAGVK